jgi:predicted O-linked N-acetylglucosamine transferase (SPINDLY family)
MMSKIAPNASARNDAPQESIARAVDLHQAGQLDAAADIYKQILARAPRDFDANHLLGVVALQQGQFETAQGLINLALSIRPSDASAMGNLGLSYLRDGKPQQALPWLEKARAVEPNSPIALTNLASVLLGLDRHEEAIPLARKARELDPEAYDACNVLGACLLKAGDERAAADVLEAATRLQPDQADAWANLSTVLRSMGQDDLANECADKVGALKPDSVLALTALAARQYAQSQYAEAIESYRKLVLMAPQSADIRTACAHALLAYGLNEEALEQLNRAKLIKDRDLAIRWAIALAQLKRVYWSEPEKTASRAAFGECLRDVKEWYERTPAVESPFKAVGVSQPFFLAYHPHNNRELLRCYGELCTAFMSTYPLPSAAVTKRSSRDIGITGGARKLRLGVVSGYIRRHSVWNAITKGWLRNLDRSRFEIHIFQLDAITDEETEFARSLAVQFEDQPRELSAWIRTIQDADLDIILYPEISMHALTLKLACLRLAPVQATTWGHPQTTGLPTIDLYISGAAIEPANAADNYTERLVILPDLGVCPEPLEPEVRAPNLRALKLPRDQPLLLCAGMPFKYAPQYDDVWVQIARRLGRKTLFRRSGGGRLVFFTTQGDHSSQMLQKRLRAAFDAGGLEFDAHVSCVPVLQRAEYFGLMQQSALLLDTPGFSGFNTALQAIECSLPVLAFEGEFMCGRLASGIMRQLDLPELVATTTEEFVQKAVELAQDPAGRKALQARIEERREKLFRDPTPVRALENCLLEACANASASRQT